MMIVIIHELNHYLRRVKRKDEKIEDCLTGRTQSVEGGELMFNQIFGVNYMNKLDFLLQKEIRLPGIVADSHLDFVFLLGSVFTPRCKRLRAFFRLRYART